MTALHMDTRVPLFSWGFSCLAMIARIELCSPSADGRPEPSCAWARHCPSHWLRFHFRRKTPRQLNSAPKPIIWRIFLVEWPAEVWSQGKTSFLVCVFGEFVALYEARAAGRNCGESRKSENLFSQTGLACSFASPREALIVR